MSSREIAELTRTLHTNVLRDIRSMLAELGQTELSFEPSYPDSAGRALPMFALPKDLTITLVAGCSVPLRHRIVTRWMELDDSQIAMHRLDLGSLHGGRTDLYPDLRREPPPSPLVVTLKCTGRLRSFCILWLLAWSRCCKH